MFARGARPRIAAAAFGLWAAGFAPAAFGAPRTARLLVTRGPEAADCPDTEALRTRIDAHVRASVWAPASAAADLDLEVRIDRDVNGLRAAIRTGGGEREILDPGPSCEALADALAVTLALLLDPDPPAPAPPPPTAAVAPVVEAPGRVWTPPVVPPPDLAPPRHDDPEVPAWAITVGGAQTAGLLGSSASALVFDVRRRIVDPLAIGAGVVWAPRDEVQLGPGSVALSLFAVGLDGCVHFRRALGPVGLAGCVGGSAGVMGGQGEGYDEDVEAEQTWGAVTGTGLAEGTIAGPIGYFAAIRMWVPVTEGRFVVENTDAELVTDRVAVGGAIGLQIAVF